MTKYKPSFLYRVKYLDGSEYQQNEEDTSITDPTKSCYHDLTLHKIHLFTLTNGLDSSYTLDLTDGGIAINNAKKIYLTDEPLTNFKIVHYRRVTVKFMEDTQVNEVVYVLGYFAQNKQGQEVNHTITIR